MQFVSTVWGGGMSGRLSKNINLLRGVREIVNKISRFVLPSQRASVAFKCVEGEVVFIFSRIIFLLLVIFLGLCIFQFLHKFFFSFFHVFHELLEFFLLRTFLLVIFHCPSTFSVCAIRFEWFFSVLGQIIVKL